MFVISLIFLVLVSSVLGVKGIAGVTNIYDDSGTSPWLEIDGSCVANTYPSGTTAAGLISCSAKSASGTMNGFDAQADSGTNQQINNTDTLLITAGTGISTSIVATDTVEVNLTVGSSIESSEITDATIIEADLAMANAFADEDIFGYKSASQFNWSSCTEAFGAGICDGNDAVNDAVYDCTSLNTNSITAEDVSCTNCVALGSETTGNYLAAFTAGTDITIGGSAGEAWTATIGITADSVNADSLADDITLDAILLIQANSSSSNEVKICNGACTPSTSADDEGDLYVEYDMEVDGNIYGSGADLAEKISSRYTDLESGDVVIVDAFNDVHVTISARPYATDIAGVVSTAPGIILGNGMHPDGIDLALVGQVPVKVTNENGPIKRGDLLTTSSTPGHAMKCLSPSECKFSMIGKALEELNDEQGKIMVLLI